MSLEAIYEKYVADCKRFNWGTPAPFIEWLKTTRGVPERVIE